MQVTRTQLRKLRNKVYVRLVSNQHVKNHLVRYKAQTEAFMEEKKAELSVNEIAALIDRIKKTENAAAQYDTEAGAGCEGEEIVLSLGRLRTQCSGSSIAPTNTRERKFLTSQCSGLASSCEAERLNLSTANDSSQCTSMLANVTMCSDMTSSLACTVPTTFRSEESSMTTFSDNNFSPMLEISSKSKAYSLQPTFVCNLAPTCMIEESSKVSSNNPIFDSRCVITKSMQTDHLECQKKSNMLMLLQAILVMLVIMQEFISCILKSKPPLHCSNAHLSSQVLATPGSHQSTQIIQLGSKVEFRELVGLTRNLAGHWVSWVHHAVWIKILSVIVVAKNIFGNLRSMENWVKVRDIFLE